MEALQEKKKRLITLLHEVEVASVIPGELQFGSSVVIKLDEEVWADAATQSVETLIERTQALMSEANAVVAYGRYLENRASLYSRSPLFKQGEILRSVHLGIDITVPTNTSVFSPLPAKLHSYADNANFGDYGPTLILEHQLEDITFFTLYGHLSKSSLTGLKRDRLFSAGEQIATVGCVEENGCWPPHLHFQIILDLQGWQGGFPGVAAPHELEKYQLLCPDPNLLLRVDPSVSVLS